MRQVKDHYQANKKLGDIIDCSINCKKMKKLACCSRNIYLNYKYPELTYVLTLLKGFFFFKFLSRSEKSRLLKNNNNNIERVEKAASDFWRVARFSFDSKSHLGPYSTNPFYLKIFLFRALRKNHCCSSVLVGETVLKHFILHWKKEEKTVSVICTYFLLLLSCYFLNY